MEIISWHGIGKKAMVQHFFSCVTSEIRFEHFGYITHAYKTEDSEGQFLMQCPARNFSSRADRTDDDIVTTARKRLIYVLMSVLLSPLRCLGCNAGDILRVNG